MMESAAAIMKMDWESRRLEARDRAIANSIARKMMDERFRIEDLEEPQDIYGMASDIALFAAYEAIQEERKHHLEDMKMLRAWADAKWAEDALKPRQWIVPKED